MHRKEYGKLTADQFREFILLLPDVFAMLRGADEHLASTPAAKFDSVIPGNFGYYSHVYALPSSDT